MHAAGGPELCSVVYTPPLYKREHLPHSVFKRQLAVWQGHLQQQALPHASPHLTLDVAMPSYRANPVLLEKLLTCSMTEPAVSIRFLLQIDQPKLPASRARVGGSRSATIRCGLLLGGAKQHCLPQGSPKTGGGEDVDFCLRLPGHLVSVPGAVAYHPLWPGFQVQPKHNNHKC